MGKFKYTPFQKQVLDDESKNLLVSASAGSGKTATVIEKIYEILFKKQADLSELLVITFTEAASIEMKLRLKEKLFSEFEDNFFLGEQITKLPTSDISTIHGFCSKMIRKYFYVLGLNANFVVLDENNSKFLKANALEKVIKYYSSKKDNEFISLSQIFGGGRSFSSLKLNILSFYDFLCAVDDKNKFKKQTFKICYDENLNKNKACEILNDYISATFYYYQNAFENFRIRAYQQKAGYFVNYISTLLNLISGINYKNNFINNRNGLINLEIKIYSKKEEDDNDKLFEDEFSTFYKDFTANIKELRKIVLENQSYDELINNLLQSKKVLEKFVEVEELFEKEYSDLKDKKNALDFSDLEEKFLLLLEKKEVLDAIKNNYKYIFVDEYQDINNVQEKILLKLSQNCNIVMVGDIKQSIYGFRNSSPEIFVNKAMNYSSNNLNGTLINLNENFRSNPIILNFVNEIFKKCMFTNFGGVDYLNCGQLEGKIEYPKSKDKNIYIEIIDKSSSENEEGEDDKESFEKVYSVLGDQNKYSDNLTLAKKEGMIVAQKILKLVKEGYYFDSKTSEMKKISFGDISILARGNDFLKEISKVLLELRIPVSTNAADNFYKNKDVLSLYSLLKILNNFHDDNSLSVVLTSFFGKFSFDELFIIRNEFFEEEFLYESLKLYAENGTNESLKNKVNSFLEEIIELRNKMISSSIFDILNYVQEKYDFFNYFKSLPDGENRCKIIKNYINGFDGADYNFDLNRYIDFVDNFANEEKFSVGLNSSPDSVKVGTIHSSKGLEFPVVFLVGCGKKFSFKSSTEEILKDKDFGLGINYFDFINFSKSSTLAKNAIALNLKRQQKAEELRLLYVALTRAKNNLYIIGDLNFSSLLKISSSKDAETASNMMTWILSSLNDIEYKNLIINKKGFNIDKFNLTIEVFSKENFFINEKFKDDIQIKKISNQNVAKLKNLFSFNFREKTNLALKNTVSSMLQEYGQNEKSFVCSSPKTFTISDENQEDFNASTLGTIYHKIMQRIDFLGNNNIEDIIKSLQIEDKYKKLIDISSIIKCVDIIKKINVKMVKKEVPFLSYLKYNEIFKSSKIDDKILIQGVADLIIQTNNNEYILIDYKTTKAKYAEQLVEKYKLQLQLYAYCLEQALNIKFKNLFIYSFTLNKLIEI